MKKILFMSWSGDAFYFEPNSSNSFEYSDTIDVDVSLSLYKSYNCKQTFVCGYNKTIQSVFVIFDCQNSLTIKFIHG